MEKYNVYILNNNKANAFSHPLFNSYSLNLIFHT